MTCRCAIESGTRPDGRGGAGHGSRRSPVHSARYSADHAGPAVQVGVDGRTVTGVNRVEFEHHASAAAIILSFEFLGRPDGAQASEFLVESATVPPYFDVDAVAYGCGSGADPSVGSEE